MVFFVSRDRSWELWYIFVLSICGYQAKMYVLYYMRVRWLQYIFFKLACCADLQAIPKCLWFLSICPLIVTLCLCLLWLPCPAADGDLIDMVHVLYAVQWATLRACYWFCWTSSFTSVKLKAVVADHTAGDGYLHLLNTSPSSSICKLGIWSIDELNKMKSAAIRTRNVYLLFQFHPTVC